MVVGCNERLGTARVKRRESEKRGREENEKRKHEDSDSVSVKDCSREDEGSDENVKTSA